MRKVFRALEVNENDNVLTAVSKGMVRGLGISTLSIGAAAGILMLVGNMMNNDKNVEVLEEKIGA